LDAVDKSVSGSDLSAVGAPYRVFITDLNPK